MQLVRSRLDETFGRWQRDKRVSGESVDNSLEEKRVSSWHRSQVSYSALALENGTVQVYLKFLYYFATIATQSACRSV